MKYYAIINEEQKGPFELTELPDAGVTPETYVWCKGMSDWQPAGEVADICRFYRNRLFDIMHPDKNDPSLEVIDQHIKEAEFEEKLDQVPVKFRYIVRKTGVEPGEPLEEPDTFDSQPPAMLLAVSIALTILCCPLAIVAIYFSIQATKAWKESQRSNAKGSGKLYTDDERTYYRRLSYDYARSAKMWIGISFFIGLILYAFLFHKSTV